MQILVSWPGLELAVKARSPNHWTLREFPVLPVLIICDSGTISPTVACFSICLGLVPEHRLIYLATPVRGSR